MLIFPYSIRVSSRSLTKIWVWNKICYCLTELDIVGERKERTHTEIEWDFISTVLNKHLCKEKK